MAHKFHFISGLPRSGSTLTGALLRQNPRYHAGMSSPIANLFEGIIGQVSALLSKPKPECFANLRRHRNAIPFAKHIHSNQKVFVWAKRNHAFSRAHGAICNTNDTCKSNGEPG